MSLSETFYWHDYETSGAEVSTDRPLQFAGVRTDTEFTVVGEPLMLYSQPTPDYLPHPVATRITGISPFHALRNGVPEREFISRIHEQLSAPGTCGVGYNSIRFDDEITRYTLYRNFFDPYARERDQGRSRWDLIDVARALYALRPDGVNWPRREDGLPSFRLEDLSAANGIDHGSAHDALSDVYATIGLAKCLKTAQPALFETLYAQRSKERLLPLLDLRAMKPVVHISGMFGAARSNLAVVVPLAEHPRNRNEIICADLATAPDFLSDSVESVRARLFARQEALAEGEQRPPLKTIRINRSPVVLPTEWLKGEVAQRLNLDGDQHRIALAALRQARDAAPQDFKQFIQGIYADQHFAPRTDPDGMLYSGFFDRADSALFPRIQAATPEALRDQSWVFRDPRLPELLFRYRARNYPNSLTAEELSQWQEHCRQRLSPSGAFNYAEFRESLASELSREDLSDHQREALNELGAYAKELITTLAVPEV